MPLNRSLTEMTTQGTALATFDYEDVINGLGYVIFNGFNTIDDTTASYALTPNTLYSNVLQPQSASFGSTSFTLQETFTFDSSAFTIPRDVKGLALVNIPISATSVSTGDCSVYAIVKMYHYDGSTETQMGTDQQTGTLLEPQTAKEGSYMYALQNNITTQQHFAEGDVLRIKVELWGKVTANTGFAGLYCDPKDRAVTSSGTNISPSSKLEFHIPFKIDV